MVFLKKLFVILSFLALSAGSLFLLPAALRAPDKPAEPLIILRVWNADQEIAVRAWLREQAKAFERATGQRVYLRAAAAREALDGVFQGLPPDALILPQGDRLLALRGYALIVRDETAAVSPAPTGALFFRPSSVPEAAATPAAWPNEKELGAILCPEALLNALPGTVSSAQPAKEFEEGKASAALLTPGQAAALTVGYRALALPEEKGFLPVKATAYTEAGQAFLSWLQGDAAQRALAQAGLFSPRLRLYGPGDPLRYLLECGLFSGDNTDWTL